MATLRRMTRFRLIAGLVLALVLAGGGLFGWWWLDLRWRPHTITHNQQEIAAKLEQAGWVSPGKKDKVLYMVSFRSCPDCLRFKAEEFPAIRAAGVETRVIEVARRDVNGIAKSTPAERATVAELWINRDYRLMERWESVPADAWTAPGLKPADGDAARTAVIEAGRTLVDDLQKLAKPNGIDFAYPFLVWWDEKGQMRGCACEKRETYRFVRKELGV
jgi:hypothetical protein